MDYLKLKEEVVKLHIKEVEELKKKKSNINSNYTLALIDFKIIDNMNDAIDTYEKIIGLLDDLQESIVNRNSK